MKNILLLFAALIIGISEIGFSQDPPSVPIISIRGESVSALRSLLGISEPIIAVPPAPVCPAAGGIAFGAFVGGACCCAMFAGQAWVCSDPDRRELLCRGLRNIQAEGLDTYRF